MNAEDRLKVLKREMDKCSEGFYRAGLALQAAYQNFYKVQAEMRIVSGDYYTLKEELENKRCKKKISL